MNGKLARMTAAGALTLAIGGGIIGASPASAKGSDVVRTGNCSGTSDWKLKLHSATAASDRQRRVTSQQLISNESSNRSNNREIKRGEKHHIF